MLGVGQLVPRRPGVQTVERLPGDLAQVDLDRHLASEIEHRDVVMRGDLLLVGSFRQHFPAIDLADLVSLAKVVEHDADDRIEVPCLASNKTRK